MLIKEETKAIIRCIPLDDDIEEGISLIRSLNVYDYSFSYENLAYIDEVQAKKLSNVEIHENDIFLFF